MSRRNKLLKFSQLFEFPNVFQHMEFKDDYITCNSFKHSIKDRKWYKEYFKKSNPLVLELGCGRGEYSIAMAERYPEKNFIGIDIKGARMWKGAKDGLDLGLTNVAFLRTRVEKIIEFFDRDEISEIWLTFPDPYPERAKRRLTSPYFLNLHQQVLKPQGLLHLKTDDLPLFEYTKEVLTECGDFEITFETDDISDFEEKNTDLKIRTTYENIHRNEKPITYLMAMKIIE